MSGKIMLAIMGVSFPVGWIGRPLALVDLVIGEFWDGLFLCGGVECHGTPYVDEVCGVW